MADETETPEELAFKKRIADRLTEVGADTPCPRCHHDTFGIEPRAGQIPAGQGIVIADLIVNTPHYPVAVTICTNCGFVALHAMGTLGLRDEEAKKDA